MAEAFRPEVGDPVASASGCGAAAPPWSCAGGIPTWRHTREPGEGQAPGRRARGALHGAPELFDKLTTPQDALIPRVGLAAAAQDGHGEPAARTPQQFAASAASRATKSARSASSRKIGRRSRPRTIT